MSLETAPWSPQVWTVVVGLLLAGQIGAISWFSGAGGAVPRPPRAPMKVILSSAPPGNEPDHPWPTDPTVFALVTPNGFSRNAWLTVRRVDYAFTNGSRPLFLLSYPMEELGDDFAELVQTNLAAEDIILARDAPALARPRLASPVVVKGAALRMEGSLQNRSLISDRPLPQEADPILINTVVRVLVSAEGQTLSAAILSSCGVVKADQDALVFAMNSRYAPANDSLAFGNLIFQWTAVQWREPPGSEVRN